MLASSIFTLYFNGKPKFGDKQCNILSLNSKKEIIVKIKMLAIAISGVLLAGCNDSNGSAPSASISAFDPAVYLMNVSADCTDGTTEGPIKTDFTGIAKFNETTVVTSPETCKFTLVGDAQSVDVTNGKSMNGVTYVIPKGLAKAGSPITGSPLTTLIAKELGNSDYNENTASTVLTALGLTDILNTTSINDLLLNTESVIDGLKTSNAANAKLLASTTAVLSDANSSSKTATEIAAATKDIAAQVVVDNPNYPTTPNGNPVKVEITPTYVDDVAENTIDPTVNKPNTEEGKAETPPTGGTGGTGSNGTNGA